MRTGQMRRRIDTRSTCEYLVYKPPRGCRDPFDYNPEKQKRNRFENEEQYAQFKRGVSLRNFIRTVNLNVSAGDLYSTLTFNNEWEVHTFEEAKRLRRNFVKCIKNKYPDAILFIVMGRGKGTSRIHFHMISVGVPEEFISKKWKYGSVVRIEPLREHNFYGGEDCGQDFTGLCIYMFDHWTEEQGGHHWFQTKNAKKPQPEPATEVKIPGGYSMKRPPKTPKGYKLVEARETKFGFLYFKYVVIPPKYRRPQRPPKTGTGTG